MMVDENDNFLILINKDSDSASVKSNPYYGIGIFGRLNIKNGNNNLIADSTVTS